MDIIFKLIRVALGGGRFYSLPENVDWNAVVDLSCDQGVAPMCVDGLQMYYDKFPELELSLDTPEMEMLKYEWFGQALSTEVQYDTQWTAAQKLASAFADAGIKTFALKGFVISECYPVPSHRYSCDFDCYLSDYEAGNRLMEERGIKVNRFHYKHSSFDFKGMHVENHHYITGWRGSARWKKFELLLQGLLADGPIEPIGETCLLRPCPLFNALFFIRHANLHFLVEGGITLRHVCDWGVFLRRYRAELDWGEFMTVCEEYGLKEFAESMTRLSEYVCFSPDVELTAADKRLLDDILSYCSHADDAHGRFRMAFGILRNGWKFRHFSGESRLACLFHFVKGYIFEKDPSL